jgi:hypothetical protein
VRAPGRSLAHWPSIKGRNRAIDDLGAKTLRASGLCAVLPGKPEERILPGSLSVRRADRMRTRFAPADDRGGRAVKHFAMLLTIAAGLAAAPALAAVPQTMSYQGVLTDNLGNLVPDGPYNFVFKIYNVPTLGAALWTETQNNIQVTRGGFNVVLGSVTPLNLPFDVQYYLGVIVNANPELAPRVQLASSPYGLSLRLPFAGTASSGGPALSITNSATGAAILANPLLQVGTATNSGEIQFFQSGSAFPTAHVLDYGGYGSAIIMLDETGRFTNALEPDADGTGGFFYVNGGTGGFFQVDGNFGGSPSVTIAGASTSTFDTNQSGDASVQLPANAISASEILDEPGIAQNHVSGSVPFTGATTNFADIVAVSITIPAAGYIVVSADAQLALFTAGQFAAIQITEVSGSGIDFSHYLNAGSASSNPSGYVPVSIHRTYAKAAGTYTFYFQCQNAAATGGPYAWNPTITALYTPTAYGSVMTAPSVAEQSQFDHVIRTSSPGNGPGQPAVTGTLVDLRELEVKAAKQRAMLESTQRQIVDAKRREQLSHSHPAAGATPPRQ